MPQFTAVVHDAAGVRFVATTRTRSELEAQVVDYIRERCDYVLWPREASTVRELIARDRNYAAIASYFASVGQRWDAEWLALLEGPQSVHEERTMGCSAEAAEFHHSHIDAFGQAQA